MKRPVLPSVVDLNNDCHVAAIEAWARCDAQEVVRRNYEAVKRIYENNLEDCHEEMDDFTYEAMTDFLRGQSISVPREAFRGCASDDAFKAAADATEAHGTEFETFARTRADLLFERIGAVYTRAFTDDLVKSLRRKMARLRARNPWRIPLLPPEEREETLSPAPRAVDQD